jgi:FkbM family methyltransferase
MAKEKMNSRVKITSSCRDCDIIEKHPKAGLIETENDKKYQYMFNGVKIEWGTYNSPWMNEIISNLKGHHEPQEELCFNYVLKTLGKEANMIELGCNWSYYTIWFNKEIEKPFNVAMEPIIDNLNDGKRNAELNECKNIDFKQGFIGSNYKEDGIFNNWDGKKIKMPMYSLEKLIKDSGKDYFDIIHSDIQGSENILLSSSKHILNSIGYFIISTHSDGGHKQCCDILSSNNFTIIKQHTPRESFSVDGLILAINNENKKLYDNNAGGDVVSFLSEKCAISKRK